MKPIYNWRKATVFDVEADGLLDEATLMHVLSYQMVNKDVKSINSGDLLGRVRKFLQYHLDKEIPVVAHNGIGYDIPLLEKLLDMDLSKLMVIDTLGISWYLNHDREVHGLDSFFDDYGIAKPKIDDWENLSIEEYTNRCYRDVQINKALWEDLMERLVEIYSKVKEQVDAGNVGGTRVDDNEEIYLDRFVGISVDEWINEILTFIMFKLDCNRLQEKTRWKVDVAFLEESLAELNGLLDTATEELESVMPKVPVYAPRNKPKKPFLKSGGLSASGQRWEDLQELLKTDARDELGHPMAIQLEDGNAKILNSYKPPNIGSSSQIKAFLFSKGWEPQTFKYVRDKEAFEQWIKSKPRQGASQAMWRAWKNSRPEDRKIPQLNMDGDDGKELCPSVVKLAEEVPEIMAYSKYTVIKHRRDMLKGMKEKMSPDGYLQASMGGFTNTFRVKHRAPLANLPGTDKPYGVNVRGALIAGKGKVSMGSDLSSLEDKVKQMFMLPHDPDYVATMQEDGYEPHLMIATVAGFITEDQMNEYKRGNKTDEVIRARKLGKSTNYASQYGSGAATLARTAKISVAKAQALLDGYWKLNFSVELVAKEQCVIKCNRGHKWLVNPINGFAYSLRTDKDRFSTLCQGTGSFLFDMWLDHMLEGMLEEFGVKRLVAQTHDEFINVFKDLEKNRRLMTEITEKALESVNKKYKLRIPLGCDTHYGASYADIH